MQIDGIKGHSLHQTFKDWFELASLEFGFIGASHVPGRTTGANRETQPFAESITVTASIIVGAWEAAGKPALKTEMPHAVRKVRTPG